MVFDVPFYFLILTELLKFISLNNVPNTTQSPSCLSLPSLSMMRVRIGTEGPHFSVERILWIGKKEMKKEMKTGVKTSDEKEEIKKRNENRRRLRYVMRIGIRIGVDVSVSVWIRTKAGM